MASVNGPSEPVDIEPWRDDEAGFFDRLTPYRNPADCEDFTGGGEDATTCQACFGYLLDHPIPVLTPHEEVEQRVDPDRTMTWPRPSDSARSEAP